jgi:TonB family protein
VSLAERANEQEGAGGDGIAGRFKRRSAVVARDVSGACHSASTPLSQLERALRRMPAHISQFSPVSEPLALPKCGDVRPPEALLTPDPPLRVPYDDLNVRVSFIIGSDGRVHSAFILDSGGPDGDQAVLRAVRLWRYRPALCNGVPTDFEALVRFSIR